MPFTPFHFGPGLLAKSVAPARFSWTAFIAANVLIDVEPLCYMIRHEYPVHRALHTFLGATLAGAAAAGLLLCARSSSFKFAPNWFSARSPLFRAELSTAGLLAGGLIGGASHPFFDGLMHGDIRPFAPFTDANPLLGLVNVPALHLACLISGLAGALFLVVRLSSKEKSR